MKLAVLSDTRVPTLPTGGHGLGRHAHLLATYLATRGHEVTLFAGPESDFAAGQLTVDADEVTRVIPAEFDGYIDLSHAHQLSRDYPERRAINLMVDAECPYSPPHAAYFTRWEAEQFGGHYVPQGIDIDAIPFIEQPSNPHYLAYAAKLHPLKRPEQARAVGIKANIPVRFAGEPMGINMPNSIGVLENDAYYQHLGQALGVYQGSCQNRGIGTLTLDAAATGSPLLCFDDYKPVAASIEHCVTGFVCVDIDDMADAVADLALLDRATIRAWAGDTHRLEHEHDALMTIFEQMKG